MGEDDVKRLQDKNEHATPGEMFVGWLGSTPVRGVLVFILLQSLYIIFSHPGHGMAETIAAAVSFGCSHCRAHADWVSLHGSIYHFDSLLRYRADRFRYLRDSRTFPAGISWDWDFFSSD